MEYIIVEQAGCPVLSLKHDNVASGQTTTASQGQEQSGASERGVKEEEIVTLQFAIGYFELYTGIGDNEEPLLDAVQGQVDKSLL